MPPPPPVAAPAVPVAPPVAYVPPVAAPPSDLAFDDAPVVVPVSRRKRRKQRGWLKVLFVFLIIAGGVAAAGYYFKDHIAALSEGDDSSTRGLKAKANFSLSVPRSSGWRDDRDLLDRVRANVVMTRQKPKGHMALFYRDFNTRALTDGELLDLGLKRLRAFFPRLEYENPLLGESGGRTGELSGEPAIVMPFSASDTGDVPVRGTCTMLSRQGYAYWLVFWGPEDYHDELAEHFEALRERFKLYNEREGWKPTPRESERFAGTGVPYQLDFIKEVWKKEPNAKDADAAAELFLRGFEPTLDQETGRARVVELSGKAAEVLVAVLPKAASLKDAVKAAEEHFRKKHVELHPGFKMEPVADRKTGKPLPGKDVGSYHGEVQRLRLVLDADNERFAVLAVANQPQGVLAVWCECRWNRREYWEQEFRTVLRTVRPATKE